MVRGEAYVFEAKPLKIRACIWAGDNLEEMKKICETLKEFDDGSLLAIFSDGQEVIVELGDVLGYDMEIFYGFSMSESKFNRRYSPFQDIDDKGFYEQGPEEDDGEIGVEEYDNTVDSVIVEDTCRHTDAVTIKEVKMISATQLAVHFSDGSIKVSDYSVVTE